MKKFFVKANARRANELIAMRIPVTNIAISVKIFSIFLFLQTYQDQDAALPPFLSVIIFLTRRTKRRTKRMTVDAKAVRLPALRDTAAPSAVAVIIVPDVSSAILITVFFIVLSSLSVFFPLMLIY